MRGLLALAAAELRQRRLLLAGSALLGLLALAAPLLPSLPAGQPAELRAATALLLLAVWTPLLALVAGATALAGELADRRIGFYLARPLSTWTIWAGKMAAAVLLPLLAGALVLLPAALAGGLPRLLDGSEAVAGVPLWLAAILGLVAIAHAASIAARSRSAWLLLDLAALALGAALVFGAVRILRRAFVPAAEQAGAIALGALVLAALVVAGGVAVHRGRAELVAAHRALSLTLWPVALAGALGLVLFAHWVVGAPLAAVKSPRVLALPAAGPWVMASGEAAHRFGYQPVFLLDAATGRSLKIGSEWFASPVFAASGRRAVWLAAEDGLGRVWTLDVGRKRARERPTPIGLTSWPQWLELSPEGERLAVLERSKLLVYRLADGRLLAVTRLPPNSERRLRFVGEDRLRLVEERGTKGQARIEIHDLALGGKWEPQTVIAVPSERAQWQLNRSTDRLLVWQVPEASGGAVEMWLYSLPAGELLAALPPRTRRGGFFLADGRVAVREAAGDGLVLRVLSRQGREAGTWRFPGATSLGASGQPSPDTLIVSAGTGKRWTTYRLDLGSGRSAKVGSELSPVALPEATGLAARLFRTEDGALVEIGERGERRVVLPRRD